MSVFTLTCIWAFLLPFIMGVLVIIKGEERKSSMLFGLTCIVSSVWALGAFKFSIAETEEAASFWIKIAHIGIILTPLFFFHFVSLLTKNYKKALISLSYMLAIFFLWLNFFSGGFIYTRFVFNQFYFFSVNINKNLFYLIFYIIFYWLILLYSFFILMRFFKTTVGAKRNQIKYFIIGSIIAWLGPTGMFLLVFGVPLYPYSNILIGVYPLIFTYAILRYRLMDIHLAIKRTMVYSLSAGILTSLFVVLVISMTKLLANWAGITSFTITVIAAITIALFFNPLRNRIQTLIDKVFYKKTYDYYATLHKVSHDLASMLDFKKIYSFVGDIIFSTFVLKSIYILSAGVSGNYESIYHMSYDKKEGKGEMGKEEEDIEGLGISEDSLMVKLFKDSDDIIIKDELPGIKEVLGQETQETIDDITNTLKPFNGEAVMPVFIDNKLQLLIILGEKLSGDIFTQEDINLLDTISHQTAIAMKNARLYMEKLRSERFASIGMMSATFAHEIRNPLTSIKTFAQLFPHKYADAEFREAFLKLVINDVVRIDGLIKDLLSFSSRETFPCIEDINITTLIDETLEHLKGELELEKKNINVEKFYKNVKINTMGDSKKLKQAFVNIISNGCQAMGEKGVLRVSINSNGQMVDVSISDAGKGISRKDIGRIFDPFYTTKPMGVGLGLAISKKIIEDHGGRITVESKLSKGTTFTVSLPVQETEK